jgi:hypothetical protein
MVKCRLEARGWEVRGEGLDGEEREREREIE